MLDEIARRCRAALVREKKRERERENRRLLREDLNVGEISRFVCYVAVKIRYAYCVVD